MNKRVIIVSVVVVALIALTVVKLKSNVAKVQEKIYVYDPKTAILVETETPA